MSDEGNNGQVFDRLPATPGERKVAGRASREEVLDWWSDRFGIDPATFDSHSFWEKGAGKIWVFAGDANDSSPVEAIGMTVLRTRQEHWKPTTSGVNRFGEQATRNVIELGPKRAVRFAAGEDLDVPEWDGDWGYLIVTHEIAGGPAPIGVGLYLYDELRSVVPKGNQTELSIVTEN